MQTTQTYREVLPEEILNRYHIMETGAASKIIEAVCPKEFEDVVGILREFELTPQALLTPGGSRGPVPVIVDGMFHARGWIEARIDIEKKTYFFPGHNAGTTAEFEPDKFVGNLVSRTYQKGYSIDNVKGMLAADVEWNPKDGNLDRDFAAYRAWFDEGAIVAAVLITRHHDSIKDLARRLWQDYIEANPSLATMKQPVDYGTSTTANYEKATQRILRGDLGSCPILMIGIGTMTWNRKPWDGTVLKWDKAQRCLLSVRATLRPGSIKQGRKYSIESL